MQKLKEKLNQLFNKVKNWWNKKDKKSKQKYQIAGCCLGMVTIFFGLIYIFGYLGA